ncbi:hypothetical protein OUZ56_032301 [Daphnia magna]|uniref:Uncharacterized protein n=1 Tax=Daphnia magna TaxID=35525 RepID=A0ABQ9ZWS7_9CRUS|nr:hypothetical protein OUZ56_032301 [Daphnia magna]
MAAFPVVFFNAPKRLVAKQKPAPIPLFGFNVSQFPCHYSRRSFLMQAELPRSMEMIEIEGSIDQFSLIEVIELITAGYRDRDRDRKGHMIEIFLDQDEFCAT